MYSCTRQGTSKQNCGFSYNFLDFFKASFDGSSLSSSETLVFSGALTVTGLGLSSFFYNNKAIHSTTKCTCHTKNVLLLCCDQLSTYYACTYDNEGTFFLSPASVVLLAVSLVAPPLGVSSCCSPSDDVSLLVGVLSSSVFVESSCCCASSDGVSSSSTDFVSSSSSADFVSSSPVAGASSSSSVSSCSSYDKIGSLFS